MPAYDILKDSLKDWQDTDVAMLHLARALGIIGEEVSSVADAKPVFWTKNPISGLLHTIFEELKKEGVVEIDYDEIKIRWNPNFSWEAKAAEKK